MLFAYVVPSGAGLSVGVSPGVGEASGSPLGVTSALGVGVASGSPCGAGAAAGSGVSGSTFGIGVSLAVSAVGSSVPADANVPYTGIAPNVSTTASIRHNNLPAFEILFRFFLNLVPSLS